MALTGVVLKDLLNLKIISLVFPLWFFHEKGLPAIA
jgi:hypothetical protein